MGLKSPANDDKYRVSAHLPPSMLTWGAVKTLGEDTLVAGECCDMQVQVTVECTIPAGHNIEVWTHFVSDIERAQVEDAAQPAYFSCTSDGAAFDAFAQPEAKVHGPGSFFPYRRYAGIHLLEPAAPGARFTFRFDHVSMQTYEETLFNLRFAIVNGDQVVGYLGDAFYEVVGAAADFLRLIAPTCAETRQAVEFKIVACDHYGNKSGERLDDLSFDVELDAGPGSFSFDEIAYDAEKRLHIVKGVTFEREGVYYVRACVRDAPQVAGTSNPIVVQDRWAEKVYWGDLHQHAYYADGRGTPAANYEYAISTSCLDFCAVAPHQELTFAPAMLKIPSPPQAGWEELIVAAERYNRDELVTILGSEAGSLAPVSGHMNSYYLDASNRSEIERLIGRWWERPTRPRLESYQQYLDELERSQGEFLLLPHAHARGGPGRFDLPLRPAYQTNVEICSVHGVFEAFYEQWLAHGHFVGVHGSGDNHMTSTGNGNPGWHYPNTNGLAAAWSAARTRRGVWDAIQDRQTYAVTGNQRIYLDFSVGDHPMGSVVVGGDGERTIRVEVAGTAPVIKVELFKNGHVIRTFCPDLEERRYLQLTWTDSWPSRRVDDSLTIGRIRLPGGRLDLLSSINVYHRTDSFAERDGEIAFRSNGYSGITRGVLVATSGVGKALQFTIDDTHLERPVLSETMSVPLDAAHARVTRPLDVEERFVRPLFTRAPHHPEFILDVDWVDPEWPRVAQVEWQDVDSSPGYYYVRVEQIDGNIAWSSPIWFLDRQPEFKIPGNVVQAL
jgi:hypothetical protein